MSTIAKYRGLYVGTSAEVMVTGDIPQGTGYRHVLVPIPKETITALAKILEHTDHGGHAVWHLQNPHAKLPCTSC